MRVSTNQTPRAMEPRGWCREALALFFLPSPYAMPEIDKPNPYDEPNLRSAWEEGWNAFQEEKPPPDVNLFDDPEETEAYLDGYLAAQDHEGEP